MNKDNIKELKAFALEGLNMEIENLGREDVKEREKYLMKHIKGHIKDKKLSHMFLFSDYEELGRIYLFKRDYRNAEKAYRNSLAYSNDVNTILYEGAWLNRVYCLILLYDFKEALKAIKELIKEYNEKEEYIIWIKETLESI